MFQRCTNEKSPDYKDYGGRGITVCERWKAFENFLEDMGERPSIKLTLERADNNGHYEPNNCRWATIFEQRSNHRGNVFVEHNGVRQTVAQWARQAGITHAGMRQRLKLWPKGRALSEYRSDSQTRFQ
jgi:hypothetical protein